MVRSGPDLRNRTAELIALDLPGLEEDKSSGDKVRYTKSRNPKPPPAEPDDRRDPGDFEGADRLARLRQRPMNDAARGEAILDALARDRPASAEARLIRYRYFARLHRNDRAIAELDEATRPAPEDIDVRMTAARDAVRRGDPGTARRNLAATLQDARSNLRVRVMRGLGRVDKLWAR